MSESKSEAFIPVAKALSFNPTYRAGDIIEIKPSKLKISDDKTDVLFDVRGLDPADKALVQDITEYGFGSVIWAVEREKGQLTVVAGRRRTNAAIEAGDEEVNVLILPATLSDYELVARMVAENEFRAEDTLINRARKAERLYNMGIELYRPSDKPAVEVDEETGDIIYNGEGWRPSAAQKKAVMEDVAKRFNVTKKRIEQLLSLLELSPKVQKALEAGQVAEAVAIQWKDKTHERQDQLLDAAKEKAKGLKLKGKGSTRNADGQYPKLQFKRPELEAIRESEGVPKQVAEFLNYYLGYAEITDAPKWLQKMFESDEETMDE